MQVEVTPEAVIEMAATKIVNEFANFDALYKKVEIALEARIDKLFAERINDLVEDALNKQLDGAMRRTIQPVDIFGDPVGEPTTIQDTLAAKAKEFWTAKVDDDGKVPKRDGYYHKNRRQTRAEYMLGKVVADEFAALVKANAVAISEAFKEAVRADLHKQIDTHLDTMINPKRKR